MIEDLNKQAMRMISPNLEKIYNEYLAGQNQDTSDDEEALI